MNNREYYRAAFSQVKAPEDAVENALNRRYRKKRRMPWLVPVAAALVLLTTTAYAELDNGGVSNLLAPLFGCAQTELIDSIGYPIDAAASVNGYTITADAVIGDRYTMYIVYTLSRDDGEPLPDGTYFADFCNSAQRGSGGGYLAPRKNTDGTVTLIEQCTSEFSHLGRNTTVVFKDLSVWDEERGTSAIISEGTWELRFALRYQDTTERIPVKDLTVTDEAGNQYEIQKVLLSALSFRLEMTAPSLENSEGRSYSGFSTALRFKDGTIEPIRNFNCSSSGVQGEQVRQAKYTAEFDIPHLREDIEAIIICGAEIPVN